MAGVQLGNDSMAYDDFMDNSVIDITPTASENYYAFDFGWEQHKLKVKANGTELPEEGPSTVEFCVGQKIDFTTALDPPVSYQNPPAAQWSLSGNYVNDSWTSGSSGSVNYYVNSSLLSQPSTSCWYVGGGSASASVGLGLQFSNGHYVAVTSAGQFNVYRPSVSLDNVENSFFWAEPWTFTWWLQLGDESTGQGGLNFDVLINTSYPGQVGITQLCQLDYSGHFGTWSFSDWRLDGGEFYEGPVGITTTKILNVQDFPGNESSSPNRLKGSFKDYVRFRPAGTNNIWVTLGRLTWSMHAQITATGPSSFNYDVYSLPNPAGPDGSSEFPYWEESHP